jgi:hypothetical protein
VQPSIFSEDLRNIHFYLSKAARCPTACADIAAIQRVPEYFVVRYDSCMRILQRYSTRKTSPLVLYCPAAVRPKNTVNGRCAPRNCSKLPVIRVTPWNNMYLLGSNVARIRSVVHVQILCRDAYNFLQLQDSGRHEECKRLVNIKHKKIW